MKPMYIAFIVIGVLLTVVGIVGLANHKEDAAAAQPQIVERVIEREVRVDTVTVPTPAPIAPVAPIATASEQADNAPMSNKEKGNRFEDFVANLFTDRDVFTVLEWNQGVTSSEGVYAENNVNPDFKIKHKFTDSFDCTYWVECKYQSRRGEDALTFNNYQVERYRTIQRDSHLKVIMAVGVGGTPDAPASFYVIPLDSVAGNSVPADKLSRFYLSDPRDRFAYYIKNYFQRKVFRRNRQ